MTIPTSNRGYHSGRLRRHLEFHLPDFSGLPQSDRQKLSYLFHALYHEKYAHKKYNGYSFLPQQVYRRWFGRANNRDQFNILREKFGWIISVDTFRFGGQNTFTKAYKLAPALYQLLESFYGSLLTSCPPDAPIKTFNGRGVHTLPGNAICSVDQKENNAKTRARLRSSVEINPDTVYEALVYVHQLFNARILENGGTPPQSRWSTYFDPMPPGRLKKSLAQLRKLHDMAHNEVTPPGAIPQRYVESTSGRLYGAGLNLQNVVREVKKVALRGKDLIELDFSNCHYSILSQLARKHGVHYPAIDKYIAQKSAVRESIAKQLQLDINLVKQCLLALIYGARLVSYPKNSLPQLIGSEKVKQFNKHPFVTSLKDDIDRARQALIEAAPRCGGLLVNKMRKGIDGSEKKSVLLAHLLQGVEAKMLNITLGLFGDQIYVLQHDGWIAKPGTDPTIIEDKIRETLGLRLQIEQAIDYTQLGLK